MPLLKGKSKKAFGKNVATEIEAGKPQDQSLAIAYSMQKRKKMAKGGKIENESSFPSDKADNEKLSMIDRIISQRKPKMMADGGMVDIEDNAKNDPMHFDELSLAALKENYNSGMDNVFDELSHAALKENYNEHGNDEENSIRHSMVDSIRRKMSRKGK